MKRAFNLLAGDLRNIFRDPLLALIPFAPILVALVIRFAFPYLNIFLWRQFHFNLAIYYSFILSIIILSTPVYFGMIIGFLLLDERDEQILNYIAVTPLRKAGFLVYRTILPVIVSIIFSYMTILMVGIVKPDLFKFLPVALMVSLEAPVYALFLGAFAGNKIEGLALAKGMGVLFIAPAVGYFIKSNWQFIAGIVPLYWVSKSYLAMNGPLKEFWLFIIAGFLIHGIVIYILLRIFKEKTD
jgi:fluoroquinolone transport system permease protein